MLLWKAQIDLGRDSRSHKKSHECVGLVGALRVLRQACAMGMVVLALVVGCLTAATSPASTREFIDCKTNMITDEGVVVPLGSRFFYTPQGPRQSRCNTI